MADLVTHLCTALLPGVLVGRWRWVAPTALGTVLPDLGSRVVPLGLEQIGRLVPLPDVVFWPWGVLHEPVGCVLTAAAIALCFVPRDRRVVLAGLLLGCALHLGLDVLQDHHGEGYALLVPVSLATFELGWIGSEATVGWALPLAGLTGLAWTLRIWADRRPRRT